MVHGGDNLTTFLLPTVLKFGILNLLELSRPVQALNGIAVLSTVNIYAGDNLTHA